MSPAGTGCPGESSLSQADAVLFHLLLSTRGDHVTMEYPELKGTHQDHQSPTADPATVLYFMLFLCFKALLP